MKKLRNMLCSGIASAMLLSALPVHAANMVTTTDGHGESETVEETVRFINEHNDWGIVKANGSVQVGSQTVDLLVTFQSPEAAMANFKNKYGDELKQIQRDHGWDVLNDENYHEYYQSKELRRNEQNGSTYSGGTGDRETGQRSGTGYRIHPHRYL